MEDGCQIQVGWSFINNIAYLFHTPGDDNSHLDWPCNVCTAVGVACNFSIIVANIHAKADGTALKVAQQDVENICVIFEISTVRRVNWD